MNKVIWLLILTGCARVDAADLARAPNYDEPYRPQVHFSPPRNWMNDPNGLVYVDGVYHLFYQHHPHSNVWGPMHWGHAVSPDLVHWQHRPIALSPDSNGAIFSGSVVYDRLNTSGLGTRRHPPLVALFTSHNEAVKMQQHRGFENQSLAYSLDKGGTWLKYPGNPVLGSPDTTDFRDPKVSWNEQAQRWIMVLAVGDHVSFYSSVNLRDWRHESDFGADRGSHVGVWECPDLIDMGAPGSAAGPHVLLVSVSKGAPNGGSGTQYFVGTFDGREFRAERAGGDAGGQPLWVDYGTDNYAGVSWSGIPAADGRHLFLGWMSNWVYAQVVPTDVWRSAMTLPRELQLRDTPAGHRLTSMPIAELHGLRASRFTVAPREVTGEERLVDHASDSTGAFELDLKLQTSAAGLTTLRFDNALQQSLEFRINLREGRLELDRSSSGEVAFSEHFKDVQYAPFRTTGGPITLKAIVDRSSIEIFVNEGETVMTSIDFPAMPFTAVRLKADRPVTVVSGTLFTLNSIWAPGASVRNAQPPVAP